MTPLRRIRTVLQAELKNAQRIVVLAVGSSLRGDDAAGLLTGAYLQKKLDPLLNDRVLILFGETAPENLSGQVRAFAPSHVLVLDAIDGEPLPGAVVVHPVDRSDDNASCSTHGLPLRLLVLYLIHELSCKVTILGLQAASREIAAPPTKIVRAAARKLAGLLSQLLPLALNPPRPRSAVARVEKPAGD